MWKSVHFIPNRLLFQEVKIVLSFFPKSRVWVVALIILASTILENRKDSIKLDSLVSLQFINWVNDYTWGSMDLAYAYHYFNDIPQMVTASFSSLLSMW